MTTTAAHEEIVVHDDVDGRGDGRRGGPLRRTWSRAVEHPLPAVAVVAALARLVFALGSFVLNSQWLIPDELQYIQLADAVADGRGAEAWFPNYGQSLYDSTYVFSMPLAFLFDVFGTTRIVGQLYVVGFGVATAVLAAAIVRCAASRQLALAAGLIVGLLPSQILWSSVVLREAPVWTAMALTGLGFAVATGRARGRLLLPTATVAAGMAALAYLRPQTLVAATWALVMAALVVRARERLVVIAGAVLLAALVPLASGNGAFGLELVVESAPVLEERRHVLAVGARSATVAPPDPGGHDDVHDDAAGDGHSAPPTHTTDVEEVAPTPTTMLDQGSGPPLSLPDTGAGLRRGLSHLPRGVVDVTVRPLPWEGVHDLDMAFALAENVLWLVLYALGLAGVVLARWAWRVMAYPLIAAGMVVGIAAVTQGNLGTAFRHRGQIVWALAVLATFGGAELVRRWRRDAGDALAPPP